MSILNRIADGILNRVAPKAMAFGGDHRCPCNDCWCATNHRWCCANCNCSVTKCYGPCTP
ncbi:hypothetical protein Afil01_42410 [Actinorhabdospora filicis]|uniref:Uncharacterized protein n=1 Tax=Actinorhabdospora filicis TaxID=1785913 RepID=A0A9W6SP39_9ACTN|nr:hypothetical protein [Actinorhabdospora filicis]GLZ79434.1 hypothetical protein Afil01_42410 [Actinorhabdospora filicis]